MGVESCCAEGKPGMGETVLRAGCKVNLSLRITGVREDGWHELDTVFYPLASPFDTLRIRAGGGGHGLVLRCSAPGIDPERNTLVTAHARFAEATGFAPALDLTLEKGIPHGAGLGGGSSDAATLLLWLNQNAPVPLNAPDLQALGARIGADVPFFFLNRTCRATGIGERLVPAEDWIERAGLRGATLLLACPPVHVSTPWAYGAWDRQSGKGADRLTEEGRGAIECASQSSPCGGHSLRWLENSFESPVFESFPTLRELKVWLLQQGAFAAVMSGSGASVVGLFRDARVARGTAETLRAKDVAVFSHAL